MAQDAAGAVHPNGSHRRKDFSRTKSPRSAPCPASGFGRLSLAATEASSGWAVAFGDLRDGRAAAARDVLDCTPRLTGGQHACDPFVAARVFWTTLVFTFRLGLRLSLCLPTPTIVVIFPGNSGEHVEQHAIDRFEHAACELVAGIGGHRL